jgi:glycosyltransferase involved in cell wall biosynthesis
MPTYNHAHLIERALTSVLTQTWKWLEVIVVDNCSSDNTDEVVGGFKDSRVRLLKVNNGGSIAISRNLGIRSAHGEWIAFLDSDDWWLPEKLEYCARHFDKADFIYHRLRIKTAELRFMRARCISSWQVRRPVFQHMLIYGNPIATSSVIVRRVFLEEIGGFDERREIVATEDYDAWLRIALLTERFLFLKSILGGYWLSMNSASRKDMSIPMRALHASYCKNLPITIRNRIDANAAYAAGRHALLQGDLDRARAELSKTRSWGRSDLRLRALLLLLVVNIHSIFERLKIIVDTRGEK